MKFRVLIYTPQRTMVRAVTPPIDMFAALYFSTNMRNAGYDCEIVPNTKTLDRQAAEMAAKYPTTLQLVPGHAPTLTVDQEDSCDGK